MLQDEEVTVFEALVLAAIFFEKLGKIKPSTLAETFQATRGNVSHCISSLEAKGLVQRRIDPEDARAVQLVLQPQGKKREVRVVRILDGMQRRFEEGIGAAKLEAMLEQMSAVEELCADERVFELPLGFSERLHARLDAEMKHIAPAVPKRS